MGEGGSGEGRGGVKGIEDNRRGRVMSREGAGEGPWEGAGALEGAR